MKLHEQKKTGTKQEQKKGQNKMTIKNQIKKEKRQ
jgi:hypothetical protein